MADEALDYARRLARDSAVAQRVAAEGPATADAEWLRLLEVIRRVQQQLQELYPVNLTESPQQAFLATSLEALTFRRAPGQVLIDDYTMPPDRSQWRLLSTTLFGIDVVGADPAAGWQWRGTDGRLLTSEALANEAIRNLLARERGHRNLSERPS